MPRPYRANQIFHRLARGRNQIVPTHASDTKTKGLDVGARHASPLPRQSDISSFCASRGQIATAHAGDTKTEGFRRRGEACLAPTAPIRYFLGSRRSRFIIFLAEVLCLQSQTNTEGLFVSKITIIRRWARISSQFAHTSVNVCSGKFIKTQWF